jgi:hypothetical protein
MAPRVRLLQPVDGLAPKSSPVDTEGSQLIHFQVTPALSSKVFRRCDGSAHRPGKEAQRQADVSQLRQGTSSHGRRRSD